MFLENEDFLYKLMRLEKNDTADPLVFNSTTLHHLDDRKYHNDITNNAIKNYISSPTPYNDMLFFDISQKQTSDCSLIHLNNHFNFYKLSKFRLINTPNETFINVNNENITNYIFKINPSKIRSDMRTTCMIKNIPNKYTQKMLIDFINETHFGTYDFFYLRMDFKNKCNVGYAFINFIDSEFVGSFYERINNQRWNHFSSNKIAELTYASVQGIKSLVSKFKKSSVMMEDDEYRPKLFYVSGSKKGEERNFNEEE